MIIKDEKTLVQYKEAGKLSAKILGELRESIEVGVTPMQIELLAQNLCAEYQVKPSFMGVGPKNNRYQYATCISVNDTVLHGIPNETPFKNGDLVKVDFGIIYQGLYTDHCFTVGVGAVSNADLRLLKTSREAVQKAAFKAVVGNYIGDLSSLMSKTARKDNFETVKEFVGHGIGRTLHDDPAIPSYGKPHTGPALQEGMVLCVECQIVAGSDQIYQAEDGWTIKTADGAKAAMFEYMVVVGKRKATFLTPTLDWPLVNA